MKIKDDELKSIMIDLKKVIKGRPLYFGLMAPAAKRGKFRLSKKKGDTKPPTIKSEFNPYEDDKDNKLKGSACQGVITAEKGVLTLHIDGKAPGAAVKFLTHFILREVKYKVVKKVVVAEDAQELPLVPDNDEGTTWQLLLNRLTELMGEVKSLAENERTPIVAPALSAKKIIDQQDAATPEQLQQADDLLDEAFGLLSEQQRSVVPAESSPSIDVSELQQHLDHAKDMAGLLPPDRVANLASRIREGNTLLAGNDLETASDVILGLEDEIDGAFQDYFLDQLKGMAKHESALPAEVVQAMDAVRQNVRRRKWPEAIDAWKQAKNLVGQFKAESSDAPPVSNAPEVPVPPPPLPTPPAVEIPLVDEVALQRWRERDAALRQQFEQLQTSNPNAMEAKSVSDIELLFDKGRELVDKFEYEQAGMAHGRISRLLSDAELETIDGTKPEGAASGFVAFRQSQIRWNTGVGDVRNELNRLANAIRSTSEQDADLAEDLDGILIEFHQGVTEAINAGLDASDEEDRISECRSAIAVIKRNIGVVKSNEIISTLDACPFCQVKIRDTLVTALDDLSSRLTAFLPV